MGGYARGYCFIHGHSKGFLQNFEATLRIAQKWKEQQRHQDNLSSQDSQRHPASYCKDNERLLQKVEE